MSQVKRVKTRQALRRRAQISCEVVREHGFSLLGRRVLDISEDGVRVALEPRTSSETADPGEPLRVGESVWISFALDSVGLVFDFEAKIARISRGLRDDDDEPSLGLQLLSRWDAGRAYAPALSRLLLRGGLSRLPLLAAPRAARGRRNNQPLRKPRRRFEEARS